MDKITETVENNLKRLKFDSSLLEPKLKKHLEKIEIVLDGIFAEQEKLLSGMKANKPSILKISSDANIARQTLYNNSILKQYIEERIDGYNINDNNSKNQLLQNKINDLKITIEKMQIRDVNIELLKHGVTSLEEELRLIRRENVEMKQKYANLLKEKNETNKTNLKKDVIVFPNFNSEKKE